MFVIQRLVIVKFIFLVHMQLIYPFWGVFIHENNLTIFNSQELSLSLIYSLPFLSSIFSMGLWQKLGSKIGYKWILFILTISRAFSFFAMSCFPSIEFLILFRFLQGFFDGFIVASLWYILAYYNNYDKKQHILTLTMPIYASGVIGPIIGGLIFKGLNLYDVINILSIVYLLLAFIILLTLPNAKPIIDADKTSVKINGFNKHVIIVMAIQIIKAFMNATLGFYLVSRYNSDYATIGIIFALANISNILAVIFIKSVLNKYNIDSMILFRKGLIIAFIAMIICAVPYIQSVIAMRILWGIALAMLMPMYQCIMISDNPMVQSQYVVRVAHVAIKIGNLIGSSISGIMSLHIIKILAFPSAGIIYFTIYAFIKNRKK